MQINALTAAEVLTVPNNKQSPAANENGFSGQLNKAINQLNEIQSNSEQAQLKFVTGELQDVHQVTIAMQEAKIAMGIAVEVRNKLIEAYQEIARMPL